MKKLLVTAAVALALTGAAFAQKSNTKTATVDLIDDNLVDAIDTGNGEDKTLVFFGYNYSDKSAEAGWGHQFGGLWFSLYDGYNFAGSKTKTDEVQSNTVANDGVNTDYVDEGEMATWNINNAFKNTMRVALAWNNKVGASFYWKADHNKYTFGGSNPTGSLSDVSSGTTITTDSSELHAAGTATTTEWDTLKNRHNINKFGLDFNGMKIGGPNFYAKLNAIDVNLDSINRDAAWTTTSTLNGSTVGAPNPQKSYDGEYNDIAITPRIDVEFGLGGFRLFDAVQTNFVLKEEFTPTFYIYDDTYDYTEVTETNTIKTTNVTSQEVTNDDRFDWENKLTPRFNFTYDADERLTLKSRIDILVTFGNKHSGAQDYEYNETTTYYDKTSGTSTRKVETTTGAYGGYHYQNGREYGQLYDVDIFTTTVAPALSFGAVYKLVPGKFNLNIGAKLNTGALVWTTTEKTYSDQVQTEVTKTTDESGNTTTEVVIYSSASGDSVNDYDVPSRNSVKKEFTSLTPSGEVYLGGTWFLTDHVQLDMLLGTAATSSSDFTWKLNVAFGLHF